MALQEAEDRLAGLNAEINRLLEEREGVLKEWNAAFNKENQANVICVDENTEDCHELYLVNGESRVRVCTFGEYDMEGSTEKFYRRIENSIGMLGVVNRRAYETPEYQKNLIYAKACEIRENYKAKLKDRMGQFHKAQRHMLAPEGEDAAKTYGSLKYGYLYLKPKLALADENPTNIHRDKE